jgi:hypothetical protein
MNTNGSSKDELRDQLPHDLDVSAFVGPYQFPDNSRRRIPAFIYAIFSVVCLVVWLLARDSNSGTVNNGFVIAAVCLAAVALFVWSSSWKMTVNETEALVCASRAVDFAVGHASAQQVWRGLRSRPTWRVFCYSAEEPPRKRALVLVDAVDASIVEQLVEANPDKV